MTIKKQGFVNMDDIDKKQIEKNIMKNVALTEKKKSNAGRKKKSQDEKLDAMMAVYFTSEQKETVQNYCDKVNVAFSSLIKQILVEKGIL